MHPAAADDSPSARLAAIRERLGAPAIEDPDLLIYQMDCLVGLEQLRELVDVTVTSPPYNIGKAYEARLPLDEYLNWSAEWISAVHSATGPAGTFWLNLGYVALPGRAKAVPLPYLLWRDIPFFLLQEVVWHYGAGVAARHTFSPRNEKFLWYVKDERHYCFNLDAVRDPNVKYPNQKKNGRLKVNPLGKNPGDVWSFPKVTSGANRSSKERTSHPAQFPVGVIDRIIKASSNPGDIVLDPFMGSGSVAEAAIRLGRRVVGFEIREDYVEICRRRLARVRREIAAERSTLFSIDDEQLIVLDDRS